MESRIQILGLAEMKKFLTEHTQTEAAERALASGLLRLLCLHTDYAAGRPNRLGTIKPASTLDAFEGLAWNIWDIAPSPSQGPDQCVLAGGLVRHSDGTWSNHT